MWQTLNVTINFEKSKFLNRSDSASFQKTFQEIHTKVHVYENPLLRQCQILLSKQNQKLPNFSKNPVFKQDSATDTDWGSGVV